MSKIKTPEDIMHLRESGKRLARVLLAVRDAIAPGVTTGELDQLAEKLIRDGGDIPPFKGYTPHGARTPFPAALCVSVNDEIVHGIPGDRVIEEGDIVSIDLGVTHHGLVTDSAMSVIAGSAPKEVRKLVERTHEALMLGIKAARGGAHIGDIGAAIEAVANAEGYGIVRELGGHGVGHAVHEDPYVPNYGRKGDGPILKPGMVLALEPMFMLGSEEIRLMPDGYTIITEDGALSAHWEHTILITNGAPEILTLP